MGNQLQRFVRTSLILAQFLFLSACTIISGMPEAPRTSNAALPDPDYLLGPNGVKTYNAETDLTKRQLIRNELIDARMAEIDRKFHDFERKLYSEGIGSGVGTQWTLLGLTAASTLARAVNTKTAISTVATAVAGGTAAFDKEALFDKTMPVLMAQMQAEREKIRAQIRSKQRNAVDRYSWYAAESDLMQFAFAGSIPGAISAVAKDAGEKNVESEKILQELTYGTFVESPTTKLLEDFLEPGGTLNNSNEAEIKAWMAKNSFDTGPGAIQMFILSAEQEESRKRAVKELKLPRK